MQYRIDTSDYRTFHGLACESTRKRSRMRVQTSKATAASLRSADSTSFIEHSPVIHGVADQWIALGVTPLSSLRTIRHQVQGKLNVDAVDDLDRLLEALALERQEDQQIHVRVCCGRASCMRPE